MCKSNKKIFTPFFIWSFNNDYQCYCDHFSAPLKKKRQSLPSLPLRDIEFHIVPQLMKYMSCKKKNASQVER